HFDINFDLPIEASVPASLKGVVHVEQPLEFDITAEPKIRLSLGAITDLVAQLEVSSDSVLQPRSDQKRVELAQKLRMALQRLLVFLFFTKPVLTIPGSLSVSGSLPNSKVRVSQVGAVSVSGGILTTEIGTARAGTVVTAPPPPSKDFVVVGLNVDAAQQTDSSALRTGELPTGITNNIHAIVDQE